MSCSVNRISASHTSLMSNTSECVASIDPSGQIAIKVEIAVVLVLKFNLIAFLNLISSIVIPQYGMLLNAKITSILGPPRENRIVTLIVLASQSSWYQITSKYPNRPGDDLATGGSFHHVDMEGTLPPGEDPPRGRRPRGHL